MHRVLQLWKHVSFSAFLQDFDPLFSSRLQPSSCFALLRAKAPWCPWPRLGHPRAAEPARGEDLFNDCLIDVEMDGNQHFDVLAASSSKDATRDSWLRYY